MPNDFYPRFFNPQDLGNSLKEVSVDVIHAPRQDITSRWFHSNKDADLFIWLDSQQNIVKQQLSYYGQVVEWNVVEGIKTGHIVVDEARPRDQGSEIVHFDPNPLNATVDQARALLQHITALKEHERSALVQNFAAGGTSRQVSAEEFIARFGALLERPAQPGLPTAGPWKRLMTRVRGWFKL